jgi:large subunit ribosomal protein L25
VKVVTHGRGDLTIVSMVAPVEELIAAPEAAAPVDPKAKGKGKK